MLHEWNSREILTAEIKPKGRSRQAFNYKNIKKLEESMNMVYLDDSLESDDY